MKQIHAAMRCGVMVILAGLLLVGCDKQGDQKQQSSANEHSVDSSSSVAAKKPADIVWPDKYEATQVPMELIQVSQHCYYVQGPPGTPTDNEGFMSNAGVVITPGGVVVFDSLGTPSLAYKLLARIKAITDQPIVKVIVSHYHADHIYGLQVFKEAGAEVVAPEGAKDYLASDAAQGRLKERRESLFPWVNEETYIVKPDVFVNKDTEIKVDDVTLKLIVLGSTHSQGDMMMRVEPDQVVYSGDLIFEGRIPFVAGSHPGIWLQRLGELDTRDIKAIIPGHGAVSDQPQQALMFTKGYLEYLYKQMGGAVDELVSFDEAYRSADWSAYDKLPAFQANRMNAYFLYLKLEAASVQ